MSPALGEPQVLSHVDALKRIYAISLYAVDNLHLASAIDKAATREMFMRECMDSLEMMQHIMTLATPTIEDLGE